MKACSLPSGNVFGPVAGIAAYTHGDAYVDELCAYLDGNIRHMYVHGKRLLFSLYQVQANAGFKSSRYIFLMC